MERPALNRSLDDSALADGFQVFVIQTSFITGRYDAPIGPDVFNVVFYLVYGPTD
jgi:hypothetical protein